MKKLGRIGLALLICVILSSGLTSGTAYAAEVRDNAEEAEASVPSDHTSESEELYFGDESDLPVPSEGLTKTRAPAISEETRNAVGEIILTGLQNWSESIDLSAFGLTVEEGVGLYYEVLDAHYEFFYVKSCNLSYSASGLTSINPIYDTTYTNSDVSAFNSVCSAIVAGIPQGTNAEKLLYLHDYLITHCEYDLTYSKTNAYNALVEGSAVCDGYTKAYKVLCDQAGLTCEFVSSDAINHSWNMVQVGGGDTAWYYVDCTWDDPINGSSLLPESNCRHANFLMSREACINTNHASSDWVNGKGESVYNRTTSTKYDSYWWRALIRSVQWVGTQMCYAKPTDLSHVYFRSSGSSSETSVTIQGGGNRWNVLGESSSYWTDSYITIASQGGAFYYSTPTQIWKLTTGGAMSLTYTLTSAEQKKGYIYGIQGGANKLTYYIGQDPNHASVASGVLDLTDPTVPAIIASGTCGANGDNLTRTLDENGVLTITGTGAMADFATDDCAPWYVYRESIHSVVIDPGVTSIGKTAFYRCSTIKSISIPEGVTNIGVDAFYACSGLKKILLPNTTEIIGDRAFSSCTALAEVTIPEGVTSIGSRSFEYCTCLTAISLPSTLTSIGSNVFGFENCLTSLQIAVGNTMYKTLDNVLFSKSGDVLYCCAGKKAGSYTIPDGVMTIESYAFSGCGSLTAVVIPEGVKRIGDQAFGNCGLTSVTIPTSMETIENNAFAGCGALTDVYYGGTQ